MTKTLYLLIPMLALVGCGYDYTPTADTKQQEAQEKVQAQGVAEVGLPGIVNFTEMKALKELYELRDQSHLVTYSYTQDMNGHLHKVCNSIGYPFPYAAQYSNPSKYTKVVYKGTDGTSRIEWMVLPQAEPNGVFMPSSADGTWVRCIVPGGNGKVAPVYVEPHVLTYPWEVRAVDDLASRP